MSFIFDYKKFKQYYLSPQNLIIIPTPIIFTVFARDATFKFSIKQETALYTHKYIRNLYITKNNDYLFFNLIVNINGIDYGNHFSVGLKERDYKTKLQLVDIHYTIQDPLTQTSINTNNKCFIFDGKQINLNTIKDEICEIPRNKPIGDVFNDLFTNYITIILATPFVQRSKLDTIIKSIHTINSSITSSRKNISPSQIITGSKGGKYIMCNNKKKYIKKK
jgi:hypothetical protein